jgi:hypothetical protein
MAGNNVINLDILRPKRKVILLNGKEIDVSFIPVAITFELDALVQDMGALGMKYSEEELSSNPEAIKSALDLTIKMCAAFCSWQFPEMDEEWFKNNTDAYQMNIFATHIKDTLMKSLKGIGTKRKNQ